MTIEVRIEEDIVTDNVIICDCTGANINHIMMFTPTLLKKLYFCIVRNYDLDILITG